MLLAAVLSPLPICASVVVCTLISIVLLPHDLYHGARVTWTTALLGPNLRIISCIFLPFTLLVWPPVVFVCSLIGAFFYLFFGTTVHLLGIAWDTRDGKDTPLCVSFVFPFVAAAELVGKFWQLNHDGVAGRADRYVDVPENWSGRRYDIPLVKMPLYLARNLVLFIWGSLAGLIGMSTLALLLYVPILLHLLVLYVERPLKLFKGCIPKDASLTLGCMIFPFWLVGLFSLILFSPLGLILAVCVGLGCGFVCVYECVL